MAPALSRRAALTSLSALAAAGILGNANAQAFPNRPVRLIMPWPPGGGGDTQTRMVMQRVADAMGQPIVVDNKAGANGLLGTKLAIAAPPDGYTLMFGVNGQITLGPLLNKDSGFDPLNDLVPVSGLSTLKMFLVVPTASPYKSVQDLVAAAKADPDKLSYGSTGVGSMSHVAAAQLAHLTGTRMTHIPYQSGSHVTRAMLAGDLHFTFVVGGDLSAQMKAGTMRPLGTSGDARSAVMPDIPTLQEQGVSGWMPGNVWFGLFAPAKTPQPLLDTWHGQIARALAEPEIVQRLKTNYFAEPWPVNSREFTAVLKIEIANFAQALKAANISAA
ncbi:MAG: tripartite tricarboxylate transporter substrate binding protein [Ramlibacter sp.]|nr:tripartite tricarboxylate transporter substrate binding protein [Ramlibacter sp.]